MNLEARLRAFAALVRHRSFSAAATELRISQPAVSKHLTVLRRARLVNARVDAQRRVYRVEPGPLREIDDWLAPYRALWPASLDALERHLDQLGSGPWPDATDERSPGG